MSLSSSSTTSQGKKGKSKNTSSGIFDLKAQIAKEKEARRNRALASGSGATAGLGTERKGAASGLFAKPEKVRTLLQVSPLLISLHFLSRKFRSGPSQIKVSMLVMLAISELKKNQNLPRRT